MVTGDSLSPRDPMFHKTLRSGLPPAVPDVDSREAFDLLRSGRAVILDVREPDEWKEVRIPGAIHVPLGELGARARELPRDRAIVAQCRSGNRSRVAAEALAAAGFRDVRNLAGGIQEWIADAMPVEWGV